MMINKYDILRFQLFQLLCCEAIERLYVRDKLGRFAEENELGEQIKEAAIRKAENLYKRKADELMTKELENVSPLAAEALKDLKAFRSVEKKVENIAHIKQNTYSAFGVNNPKLIDATLKAGMNSPEFIKDIALPIGLVSGLAPKVDDLSKLKDVKQVRDFSEAQLNKAEKKYEENILAQGGIIAGRAYIKHQRDMDQLRHLEEVGQTEWAGQMGRLAAFGVDAAWHATTLLGAAALPELAGGAKTLEALAPAIQGAAERRVLLPILVKDSYDLTKAGLNEKPEKVMLALAAGAMTGRVLDEAKAFAEEHPESTQNIKKSVNEIKDAADRATDFRETVNEKMKETGADQLFKEDLTFDEFLEGAKDVYQSVPQDKREIIDNLSSGASEILK